MQVDEQRVTTCGLLERFGCHRLGLWECECGCGASRNAPSLPLPDGPGLSQAPDLALLCGLPATDVPCLRSRACAPPWASPAPHSL